MDHFTPLSLRTHTAEPVPALLYDSRETAEGANQPFDETLLAAPDHLTKTKGHNLINHLLEQEG